MKLSAQQMKSLPSFFKEITDPRREQGRIHRLEIVLSMAAAATLCGMCGYKDLTGLRILVLYHVSVLVVV